MNKMSLTHIIQVLFMLVLPSSNQYVEDTEDTFVIIPQFLDGSSQIIFANQILKGVQLYFDTSDIFTNL